MEILSAKVGMLTLAIVLAQEQDFISLTQGVGYGIIGAAMVLAWRITSKAQAESFEKRLETQEHADEVKDKLIAELRVELTRVRSELARRSGEELAD